MCPVRKSYMSAPWGCFRIVNILCRSLDTAMTVKIVNFELTYTKIAIGPKMENLQICKNILLTEQALYWCFRYQELDSGAVLQVSDVQPSDAGKYQCNAGLLDKLAPSESQATIRVDTGQWERLNDSEPITGHCLGRYIGQWEGLNDSANHRSPSGSI